MVKLAAIVCFILSLCFYLWQVQHGQVTWTMWMLLGFVLESFSDHPKAP